MMITYNGEEIFDMVEDAYLHFNLIELTNQVISIDLKNNMNVLNYDYDYEGVIMVTKLSLTYKYNKEIPIVHFSYVSKYHSARVRLFRGDHLILKDG